MKFRLLTAAPFAWAALFVAVALLLGDARFAAVVRVEIESAKVLSLLGSFVAMRTFSAGDYLRRGWGLATASIALLLLRDATLLPSLPDAMLGLPMKGWEAAIVFFANVAAIASVVILARTWSVAGLEPEASKLTRGTLLVAASVVAVVVSGPALYGDVRAIGRGEIEPIASIVGDLADGVTLVVIAPVLLTTLALRGGVLRWPWGLLTASILFWLLYDAGLGLEHAFGATSAAATLAVESCRGVALLFGFSAGIAQRYAVLSADATLPPD